MRRWRIVWLTTLAVFGACGPAPAPPAAQTIAEAGDGQPEPPTSTCPAQPVPALSLPGSDAAHDVLETWLAQPAATEPALQLQSPAEVEELNARFAEVKGAWRDPGARAVGMPDQVEAAIEDRLAYLERQVALGLFVEGTEGSLEEARATIASSSGVDHQRLVLAESQLWCSPLATGLYKSPIDKAFDRNACASLHPAERVRVLRRGGNGKWLYVHAGHTVGWLYEAALSDRLSADALDAWGETRRIVPLDDSVTTTDGFRIRLGVSVPLVGDDDESFRVLIPGASGLVEATVPRGPSVSDGAAELTRARLLRVALSQLGAPYGWGGTGGGRDCSRYLRDVFHTFGVQLGRHSGVQAKLGARSIDVSALAESEKRDAIDLWAERGVVILYMPGHIMLYLGRSDGHQFAISSISEFATPCAGGDDTVHRIDKVAVGTLEIGRGAERRSFIERITRLAVFGPGLVEPADGGGAPAAAIEG